MARPGEGPARGRSQGAVARGGRTGHPPVPRRRRVPTTGRGSPVRTPAALRRRSHGVSTALLPAQEPLRALRVVPTNSKTLSLGGLWWCLFFNNEMLHFGLA